MSTKKALIFVVVLLLTLGGLLYPLVGGSGSASSTTDPATITNYSAEYNVNDDGTMTTTEVLTVNFPVQRRGIFQFWDVDNPSDPRGRYIPKIESVTRDGLPEAYETYWQDGNSIYVAKIGRADVTLPLGQHTYTIRYTTDGVISPFSAGADKTFPSTAGTAAPNSESAFFWNVIAPGWQMAIKDATIKVNLPNATGQVQCAAGVTSGSASAAAGFGPCEVAGAGTKNLTLTAKNIPPVSGMTVRATMQPPNPPQVTLPWTSQWDAIFGRTVPLVVLVLLLSVIGAVVGFLWARTSREDPPGFPVMYAPPKGLGPVQTKYMAYEEVGSHGLAATLYYLADQRLVQLERRSDDSWLVTGIGTQEQWAAVDPVSRATATKLGVTMQGGWFLAEKTKAAGEVLASAKTGVVSETRQWSKSAGLTVTAANEQLGRGLWLVALIVAGLGFIFGPATMYGLPFAAFALGGVGFIQTGVGTRRTTAGREVWSRSAGFERLLSTDSSQDRFDFAANKDLFISFIPYAIAFGVADKWAEKYRMYTHEEPPDPFWYPYGYIAGASLYSSGGGMGGFDSALSSAIGTYQASQSSSGGGGG
ncbi:MAG: DUF2207 domain-containing protein, partial [Actinobacteria bacterium]|nr:DUF2207 domain-containing protein [Actinomycetota bacterium]